jgi:hypothetical protein
MVDGVLDAADDVVHGVMPVRRQAGWDVCIRNDITRIVCHCSSNAAPVSDPLTTAIDSFIQQSLKMERLVLPLLKITLGSGRHP